MPKGPKERPFTVYVAGPMSKFKNTPGDPYGFQAFHAASRRLRELGIVVMSPAETAGQVRIMPRSWYFAFDFAVIAQCDAIVALPGWTESGGAKAEIIYATEMGIPVFEFSERDGLGMEIRPTMWDVHFDRVPNTTDWRLKVQRDTAVAAPVEAFPPTLRPSPYGGSLISDPELRPRTDHPQWTHQDREIL